MEKEEFFEFGDVFEFAASGEGAAGLDGDLLAANFFGDAPASGGVKVFESEADDIHFFVAGGAGRAVLVKEDHLAIGHGLIGSFIEFGDIGRWRCRGVVEDFFHDESPANDRRGSFAIGAGDEEGGLGEKSAAMRAGGEVDFSE